MSFHALLFVIGTSLIAIWLLGVLLPQLSRSPTAIISAVMLFVLAVTVLFGDVHNWLFDVNGEYSLAVGLRSWLFLLVSAVGLTLALLIRAKLKPFGTFEEEI